MNVADEAITSRADAKPGPEIIALRTQLASKGHTKHLLAKTDMMTMHIHCYAPKGGENDLHAHVKEDHVFVCLQGEAVFRGTNGRLPALKKHQAIFIPRGCYYAFSNESQEPCILLRFGASPEGYGSARVDAHGNPIRGRAHKEGAVAPELIEGAFFE
jgi:oxalate decarboxylase/phosphoglucose isomerase-like protein (cupin superfamily)